MPLLELRGPFAASGEAVAEDRGGEGDGANAMTVEELLGRAMREEPKKSFSLLVELDLIVGTQKKEIQDMESQLATFHFA